MTQTQRLQRLAEQSEQIQELYSSIEATKLNKAMSQRYSFTDLQFSAYLDVTGDTILGFYQTKDLPALLVQEVGVSADVANRIVADLGEMLSPVLEREAMLLNPKLGAMKELHQQFAKAGGNREQTATAYGYASVPKAQPVTETIPVPTAPAVETAAQPEPTHNVTPMRTMSADMNRIHGYGAYRQVSQPAEEEGVVRASPQDELLKERPRLTGAPHLGG